MKAALALSAFGAMAVFAASMDNTILSAISLAGASATLIVDHYYGGGRR